MLGRVRDATLQNALQVLQRGIGLLLVLSLEDQLVGDLAEDAAGHLVVEVDLYLAPPVIESRTVWLICISPPSGAVAS